VIGKSVSCFHLFWVALGRSRDAQRENQQPEHRLCHEQKCLIYTMNVFIGFSDPTQQFYKHSTQASKKSSISRSAAQHSDNRDGQLQAARRARATSSRERRRRRCRRLREHLRGGEPLLDRTGAEQAQSACWMEETRSTPTRMHAADPRHTAHGKQADRTRRPTCQVRRNGDTCLASSALSLPAVSPSFAIMAAWAAASGTLIAKSTSTETARSLRSTRRDDVFSTTDLMYRLPT
jgi:hypothetical protein